MSGRNWDPTRIGPGVRGRSPRRRRELWWHVYMGSCDHTVCQILMGESTMHPEQLLAEGKASYESPMMGCECKVRMEYVRSFDHDPSEAERQAQAAGWCLANMIDDSAWVDP